MGLLQAGGTGRPERSVDAAPGRPSDARVEFFVVCCVFLLYFCCRDASLPFKLAFLGNRYFCFNNRHVKPVALESHFTDPRSLVCARTAADLLASSQSLEAASLEGRDVIYGLC